LFNDSLTADVITVSTLCDTDSYTATLPAAVEGIAGELFLGPFDMDTYAQVVKIAHSHPGSVSMAALNAPAGTYIETTVVESEATSVNPSLVIDADITTVVAGIEASADVVYPLTVADYLAIPASAESEAEILAPCQLCRVSSTITTTTIEAVAGDIAPTAPISVQTGLPLPAEVSASTGIPAIISGTPAIDISMEEGATRSILMSFNKQNGDPFPLTDVTIEWNATCEGIVKITKTTPHALEIIGPDSGLVRFDLLPVDTELTEVEDLDTPVIFRHEARITTVDAKEYIGVRGRMFITPKMITA
jgi:hypothetical protein